MTKATFSRRHGRILSVDIRGHAGFAAEGEDIVCAAISGAVQLTHVMLDDILLLDIDTLIEEEGAHIRITLPEGLNGEDDRSAQNTMKALRLHLMALEQEYGDFINVVEVQNDAAN